MSAEQDAAQLHPRLYVFQGMRLDSKGTRCVAIGIVDETGKIERSTWYGYGKGMDKAIGRFYEGASFGEKQARGIESAKMGGRWPKEEDVAEWEAKDFQARADFKRARLEEEARKDGTIDRAMAPLRAKYNSMMARGDHTGCDAMERLVLMALRRRLRKEES